MRNLILFLGWAVTFYCCGTKHTTDITKSSNLECSTLKDYIAKNWSREEGETFGTISDEAIHKIRSEFKPCLQKLSPEDVINMFGQPSKHPYKKGAQTIRYSLNEECLVGYEKCKYIVFYILKESNTIYDVRTDESTSE